jgi:hypothetical protein
VRTCKSGGPPWARCRTGDQGELRAVHRRQLRHELHPSGRVRAVGEFHGRKAWRALDTARGDAGIAPPRPRAPSSSRPVSSAPKAQACVLLLMFIHLQTGLRPPNAVRGLSLRCGARRLRVRAVGRVGSQHDVHGGHFFPKSPGREPEPIRPVRVSEKAPRLLHLEHEIHPSYVQTQAAAGRATACP